MASVCLAIVDYDCLFGELGLQFGQTGVSPLQEVSTYQIGGIDAS